MKFLHKIFLLLIIVMSMQSCMTALSLNRKEALYRRFEYDKTVPRSSVEGFKNTYKVLKMNGVPKEEALDSAATFMYAYFIKYRHAHHIGHTCRNGNKYGTAE